MTERQKARLSEVGLLLVAFVWGAGFVVTKDTLSMLSPLVILSLRFLIASALMFILFFRRMGRIRRRDLRQGAIVGSTLLAGFLCQTYGLQYTTVTKQGFLVATYVVMVPFLFWFFYRQTGGRSGPGRQLRSPWRASCWSPIWVIPVFHRVTVCPSWPPSSFPCTSCPSDTSPDR